MTDDAKPTTQTDDEAPVPTSQDPSETAPEPGTTREVEPAPEAPLGDVAAEAEPRTRLVLERAGKETDIEFAFACPATIGRFDPSVGPIDVDLGAIEEGSYVSRKHAKITQTDQGYQVEDLGSSNGTYVLRQGDEDFARVVEPTPIEDGCRVAFGNARFVFRTL